MPLNKHYGGHGEEVMKALVDQYGEDKAKSVFYAMEKKRKSKKNQKGKTRSKFEKELMS